jgi:glycosyltransferase involved in cell wall biosynthesis
VAAWRTSDQGGVASRGHAGRVGADGIDPSQGKRHRAALIMRRCEDRRWVRETRKTMSERRTAGGSRRVIVMSGPLPPRIGGMASVLAALEDSSLAERFDLRFFDTGKTTPPGRPLWLGVATRLRLMAAWWRVFGAAPVPVAHIHTCGGLSFFLDGLLLLLSRARGAPTLLHVHGAGFDAYLDRLSAPAALLARLIARRAACVIVLSPGWRRSLETRWPGARFAVVANGVAPPPCHAASTGVQPITGDTRDVLPRFLFLGNFGRRKGVPVLLEAARLARDPWVVELAGGDEEPGYGAWLTGEIVRRGCAHRLRVLGPLVGAQKSAALASAQGFVLPSLAEGLPMAMLEAMAAGLPVAVSAVGAVPEVVRQEIDGLVLPPGDPAALAAALDRLAREPALRSRMGGSAAARCRDLFGIERMADALAGIYAECAPPAGNADGAPVPANPPPSARV